MSLDDKLKTDDANYLSKLLGATSILMGLATIHPYFEKIKSVMYVVSSLNLITSFYIYKKLCNYDKNSII